MHIGIYEIERLLGSGGFAEVYLGHAHKRSFAIKRLSSNSEPHATTILSREYECLRSLNHPNIVSVDTFGTDANYHYFSMEYLSGFNGKVLAERLQRLPANERHRKIIKIGIQILDALEYIHSKDWIHLDIKPSNIIIESEQKSTLIDFGTVARTNKTTSKGLVGTPRYASPEQLYGRVLDRRSDLFSLGATLYFLLLNQAPFSSRDRTQFIKPSLIDPSVTPKLEEILIKLLQVNPEERYGSANEVIAELTEVTPQTKPLAGRQQIVQQLALCLRRIHNGEQIHVHLEGTYGSGKQWVKNTLFKAAEQHQISILDFSSEAERPAILEAISLRFPIIVLTWSPFRPGIGLPTIEINIPWLTLAQIRRTLFSYAPKSTFISILSEKIYSYTRGLPALMLPLIEDSTKEGVFHFPNPIPKFPDAQLIASLPIQQLHILQFLSHISDPCGIDVLQKIFPENLHDDLLNLQHKSWVYSTGDQWQIANKWLQEHILQNHSADDNTVQQWRQIYTENHNNQTIDIFALERLSTEGKMGIAKNRGEHLLGMLTRSEQGTCLLLLGQIYLDIGMVNKAMETLAEAAALSKAQQLLNVHFRAQALRARCSLEKHHSSPTGASHALSRLTPFLESQDPWILSTWQWACGALGDQKNWTKWLPISLDRCRDCPPMVQFRCLFSIIRGACALGEFETAQKLIEEVVPKLDESTALLQWEYARVNSILNDDSPPVTGSLAYHLTAEEIFLLKQRWVRIKGKNPDPTWHH